ncbi:aliphatic sulfonate ABC transporter substrate-binding protein [Burkholderia sp. Ac-20379]|uniref:aliphatic sulfonate ABC transporter substrate-binding protein n=1 Tax=Burkholderia sp. Ac-20379 TaxID=2703900 RepID=UPI001980590F|nr:aliphatic sulfonate ABC transporter substrate-binding protein [Burkholderia sp. Ac-20379]MBN3728078.1 aliphatic sulfonate ABC transporter substrate-binding protein [Burkholderia sp. Ac-20379]
MSRLTRRAFSRSLLALTLSAAGPFARAAQPAPNVLRIGYQKSSTLITLLKARGTLDRALAPLQTRVEWHEFASGLPLTEALNVGAVDFSADVADTVPVFAQAAQARFVYVAQEAPSPSAQAIVVKRDGGIDSLAALKGKDIATTKAAGSHYLLLAALAKAGLTPADVNVHYLTPADGRAAFERGSVAAWITWDPYVASVDRRPDVKVLADGAGLASYQRYYLASTDYANAHPDVVKALFDALTQESVWLRAHQDEAAAVLAPIWGLDAATIARANSRRSYLVRAVLPANYGEQQQIADTFRKAGLLPTRVDTKQALRWDFAARKAVPAGA